jgi:predicted phosphohydrolase
MPGEFDVPNAWHQLRNPVKNIARVLDFIAETSRSSTTTRRNITVVCLSDTHCQLPADGVPFGDILIHAGDMTDKGTVEEIQAQIDWLDSLPHRYKLAIAGNHDTFLDPQSRQTLTSEERHQSLDWKSVIYLQDGTAKLDFSHRMGDGSRDWIKVYGLPHIPACGGAEFAFQYPRGSDHWSGKVPADVDILITHTPPKYHLDLPAWSALGDEFLLAEVRRTTPLLHVFGHVHAGKSDLLSKLRGGQELVYWDASERHMARLMSRASASSVLSGWFDIYGWFLLWIASLLYILNVARDLLGFWTPTTRMANAALMYRNSGRLANPVQVIHI